MLSPTAMIISSCLLLQLAVSHKTPGGKRADIKALKIGDCSVSAQRRSLKSACRRLPHLGGSHEALYSSPRCLLQLQSGLDGLALKRNTEHHVRQKESLANVSAELDRWTSDWRWLPQQPFLATHPWAFDVSWHRTNPNLTRMTPVASKTLNRTQGSKQVSLSTAKQPMTGDPVLDRVARRVIDKRQNPALFSDETHAAMGMTAIIAIVAFVCFWDFSLWQFIADNEELAPKELLFGRSIRLSFLLFSCCFVGCLRGSLWGAYLALVWGIIGGVVALVATAWGAGVGWTAILGDRNLLARPGIVFSLNTVPLVAVLSALFAAWLSTMPWIVVSLYMVAVNLLAFVILRAYTEYAAMQAYVPQVAASGRLALRP